MHHYDCLFFGSYFVELRGIIHADPLILSMARHEILRQGERELRRPNCLNPIRQKLRGSANVLAKSQDIDKSINTMSDLFKPSNFETFLTACRGIAANNDQMGLTIGGYIKQLLLLKISTAIQNDQPDSQRETEQFRFLMDAHFLSVVSSVAGKRQRMKKISRPDELPLHGDMNKLAVYLKKEISKISDPKQSPRLSKLVLAYLILYNKRRPMEVSEITSKSFIKEAMRDIHDNEEIMNSLSFAEKVMAKR